MPSYKVLNSVAHNVVASFSSALNYTNYEYVLGILLTSARNTGDAFFYIDFVSREKSKIFTEEPLYRVESHYFNMFWRNVENQRSSRSMVKSARLTIEFDLSKKRPVSETEYEENPYVCTLSLVDDRGIDHTQKMRGWWYPEVYVPRNNALDKPREIIVRKIPG